ncbi:MAG: ECF transporter S component [Bacteroidales bacterium]|jgi:signal transduction histidine kinase|nr:ECF transporter S component [Bacteroidales bacterium]
MITTAKLNYLSLGNSKTYVLASLFVLGNLVFPQLAHLIPQGGLIFLPIYFFTLIAAYKYGLFVGMLTAISSPLINSLFFGMPPVAVLPAIMIKSVVLVLAACLAAKYFGKVSFLGVLLAVFAYQFVGTAFEWILTQNLHIALQDIRLGFPGILIQIIGGYLVLKFMKRY